MIVVWIIFQTAKSVISGTLYALTHYKIENSSANPFLPIDFIICPKNPSANPCCCSMIGLYYFYFVVVEGLERVDETPQ